MNYKMKKDGGPKKMKKGGKKKISYLEAKKGGAKPDYLDFDKDGDKNEPMKSALASKKKMKLGGTKEMKDLKKSQREARKELRKGQRGARKEQRGQDREERKDNRARKKAIRKIKKAFKGKGMARMGAGGMRKRQTGGFLEMPTFDLDRDSI